MFYITLQMEMANVVEGVTQVGGVSSANTVEVCSTHEDTSVHSLEEIVEGWTVSTTFRITFSLENPLKIEGG